MPPMHVRRWIQTTGNMYLGCRMLDAAPSLLTTVSGVQHQHGGVMRLHVFSWSTVNSDPTFTLRKWWEVVDFSLCWKPGISSKVIPMHCIVFLFLVSANSKMFVKAWWLWLSAAMTHANIGRSWDLLDWPDNRQVARDQLQTREVARAENICEMLKIFGET